MVCFPLRKWAFNKRSAPKANFLAGKSRSLLCEGGCLGKQTCDLTYRISSTMGPRTHISQFLGARVFFQGTSYKSPRLAQRSVDSRAAASGQLAKKKGGDLHSFLVHLHCTSSVRNGLLFLASNMGVGFRGNTVMPDCTVVTVSSLLPACGTNVCWKGCLIRNEIVRLDQFDLELAWPQKERAAYVFCSTP